MLSGKKAGLRKIIGRAHTAHSFYHNPYLLILLNHGKIVYQLIFIGISRKFPEIQNIFDLNLLSWPRSRLCSCQEPPQLLNQ